MSEAEEALRSLQLVASRVGGARTVEKYRAEHLASREEGVEIMLAHRVIAVFDGSWIATREAVDLSASDTPRAIEARILQATPREGTGEHGGDAEDYAEATGGTRGVAPERIEEATAMGPLKRFGNPREIAETVLFLASDGAGVINRDVIHVEGGWAPVG